MVNSLRLKLSGLHFVKKRKKKFFKYFSQKIFKLLSNNEIRIFDVIHSHLKIGLVFLFFFL